MPELKKAFVNQVLQNSIMNDFSSRQTVSHDSFDKTFFIDPCWEQKTQGIVIQVNIKLAVLFHASCYYTQLDFLVISLLQQSVCAEV